MLCIDRKPGQSVHIGDTVTVTVSKRRGQIRLAIEAPRNVRVLRSELVDSEPLATDSDELRALAGV